MSVRDDLDLYIEPGRDGEGVEVIGYGEYEQTSVCHGMTRRVFLDVFETYEQAQAAYPKARWRRGPMQVASAPSKIPPGWFDPADAGEVW